MSSSPPVSSRQPTLAAVRGTRQIALHALSTVAVVCRSALLSVAVAWLTAWTCSLGALFVRVPVATQSYDTFMLGMLLWLQSFYCCNDSVLQSTALLRVHFVSAPDRRPTLLQCWTRVLRHGGAAAHAVSLLLMVGLTKACAAATASSPSLRALKLEYYLSCLASFTHTITVGVICRTIYRHETVEGRARLAAKLQNSGMDAAPTAKRRRVLVEWCRLGVAWLPLLASSVLSPVAVHLLTLVRIRSQLELVLLLVGSFALKALCQYVARRVLHRRRITNPRTMFLSATIPTVVIDTQVRVMLQRVSDSQLTVYGTALMALVEIATRVGKALLTRRQLRRIERLFSVRRRRANGTTTATTTTTSSTATVVPVDEPLQHRQPQGLHLDVRDKRSQLLAHRSAELFADMAAEYIAMGCSTAILFFYWDHPKYLLRLSARDADTDAEADTDPTSNAWTPAQSLSIIVPLVVEILVDIVSCLIEVAHGTTFHEIRRQVVFVAFVSVATAMANITISAVIFLRVDHHHHNPPT
ncbi:hypothetical protein PINS_up010260 [Pythium insidiosum]|nr:hypothetical protein PINS_up010260 [Pythium insidiosum]